MENLPGLSALLNEYLDRQECLSYKNDIAPPGLFNGPDGARKPESSGF